MRPPRTRVKRGCDRVIPAAPRVLLFAHSDSRAACRVGAQMSRQNVYDEAEFFAGYSQMRARGTGLHEHVVDGVLRRLLPDLAQKRVVDLGCGDGWACRVALELGAASVTGIDPSERMLERARANMPAASFVRAFAEDADQPVASADVVISVLALHYVDNVATVLSSVARWLVDGGVFVMVVEHPLVTAVKPRSDRAALPAQTTLSDVLDRYLEEGQLVERWFTDGVIKYHRRLGTWVSAIADAGLSIVRVAEPGPTDVAPEAPGIADRQPVLAIGARKPGLDD